MFSEREKVIMAKRGVRVVSDPVDLTDILVPTETTHLVFVHMFANQLIEYLRDNEFILHIEPVTSIDTGTSLIDGEKISDYISGHNWSNFGSNYAYAMVCPFNQEMIDQATDVCNENTHFEEFEIGE